MDATRWPKAELFVAQVSDEFPDAFQAHSVHRVVFRSRGKCPLIARELVVGREIQMRMKQATINAREWLPLFSPFSYCLKNVIGSLHSHTFPVRQADGS